MMKYSSTLVDKKKWRKKSWIFVALLRIMQHQEEEKNHHCSREFEEKNGEIEEYTNNSCSLIQSCVCVLLCMCLYVWWWKKLSKFPFFACQLTAKPSQKAEVRLDHHFYFPNTITTTFSTLLPLTRKRE